MIIVSQYKDTIVSFDNIEIMGIGNPLEDDEGKFKILCNTVSDNQYTIGKYATEERAKEVLQEIIDLISEEDFYHIRKSQLNSLDELSEPKYIIKPVMKAKVYEMPLE